MSDAPILVDTDVLVDFLRGHANAVRLVEANASRIVLSVVTVAELFAGARDQNEEHSLRDLVAVFPVVPVDTEIARLAGLWKRDHGPSHGTGLADALIAATASKCGASLKTLNTKHFPVKSLLGG